MKLLIKNTKTPLIGMGRHIHTDRRSGVRALCTLALGAVLLFGGIAVSRADIYLYTVPGPTNVTSTYSYNNNHVYDPDGNPIGTVGTDYNIRNDSNMIIGYITI